MSTAALELNHLQKSFGSLKAVDNLSLRVEEGEIFALLGPNGAGKSTTINMISGVCRIDGGTVSIFGADNQSRYRETRALTGVMHQEIVIDHFFTIERALQIHAGYFGRADDPSWRNTLIERLDLGPHLHKPMIQLSGGLKRRFMVAKALVHRPRLLILDEPTAGVDVELRHSLWEFVREINEDGVTVLLTTHYLEEAESMCERIAIMNHGQLVALERKEALLDRCGRRQLHVRLRTPLDQVPEEMAGQGASLEEDGSSLLLNLPQGEDVTPLLRRLADLGLPIEDFETRQPDLESVFIELTGLRQRREPMNSAGRRSHAD